MTAAQMDTTAWSAWVQQMDLPRHARGLDACCGTGAGLRHLRRLWPQLRWSGCEVHWLSYCWSVLRHPWARMHRQAWWQHDWSRYDVVYLSVPASQAAQVLVKALGEMRRGSWLISCHVALPDVPLRHQVPLPDGRCWYVYQAPLAAVDYDSIEADIIAGMLPPQPSGVAVDGQALFPAKGRPGGQLRQR